MVELIGYSGGGVLATLVSTRRNDVAKLITVASNLDTSAWTKHLGVSPLTYSINPATLGPDLVNIPQVHLIGGKDAIVPKNIVKSYLDHVGLDVSRHMRVYKNFDHDCCWGQNWSTISTVLRTSNEE